MRISPEDMFWDWVYGVYLHDDVDRLGRVEAWKPIAAHKFNFIKIASDLAKTYYAFSGIVREVADETSLTPPVSETRGPGDEPNARAGGFREQRGSRPA